ncbi:hypothetical protein [Micromonospora sp. I033]
MAAVGGLAEAFQGGCWAEQASIYQIRKHANSTMASTAAIGSPFRRPADGGIGSGTFS